MKPGSKVSPRGTSMFNRLIPDTSSVGGKSGNDWTILCAGKTGCGGVGAISALPDEDNGMQGGLIAYCPFKKRPNGTTTSRSKVGWNVLNVSLSVLLSGKNLRLLWSVIEERK